MLSISNKSIIKKLSQNPVLSKIAQIAQSENKNVFVVGGYVRDLILKRERSDIDILVIGSGIDFAKTVAERLNIRNVNYFKNFGTAQFDFDDMNIEFVGARRESYDRNTRKPIVEDGTFEDDISRRDFTINTLAVSLNKDDFGKLIDVYDGLTDIKNQIIRTPLDPFKTFDDDPLRIMRAFRFASQLNFKVEKNVMKAAYEMRNRLSIVSQERITDEFLKILSTPKPSIGLKLLFDSRVLEIVFPEIAIMSGVDQRKDYHHKDVFLHTLQVVDNICEETDSVWLRFAALVHDIAKPQTKKFVEGIGWTFHGHENLGAKMMKKIFHRMKLPLSQLEYVQKLITLHLRPIALAKEEVTDSAIRRLVVQAGEDLEDLITLCRADITSKNPYKVEEYLGNYERVMQKVRDVKERDNLRAFQSPVRGDEIMQICNLKPSRKVGEIKTAIEEAILDGKIGNNYEEALNYLMKIKDKFLSE
ncbi:MAG TPA: CCA tRNA nucleotidyltransferase [Ignavibacteriaceae bacterium]|jgi:putative nucleotidyltransferase with HDIG domain|nr:MAG: Multifunctional CCA protein [Ignavibacteria bacterium ADurb.Bin266]OQY73184.1 MAG: tRNA nucleotidyltransferase [Ignavibacteriales bacterium UTCHB2]HQF43120.1 CCA tRNA nucleotidyltransferase [Ignavibacteriaceae bacterium]HQI41068.1 CCA tRNA nucleotidyltransferase [Ignavibacteriaceae bacterium]HQJ45597.1 CCA tRNA nucleotidyltransferase [Ignavibacteriaceae bacterium]